MSPYMSYYTLEGGFKASLYCRCISMVHMYSKQSFYFLLLLYPRTSPRSATCSSWNVTATTPWSASPTWLSTTKATTISWTSTIRQSSWPATWIASTVRCSPTSDAYRLDRHWLLLYFGCCFIIWLIRINHFLLSKADFVSCWVSHLKQFQDFQKRKFNYFHVSAWVAVYDIDECSCFLFVTAFS